MEKSILDFLPIPFAIICFSFLFQSTLFSADVRLAWDPVPATGLSGYKVYYGRGSQAFRRPAIFREA